MQSNYRLNRKAKRNISVKCGIFCRLPSRRVAKYERVFGGSLHYISGMNTLSTPTASCQTEMLEMHTILVVEDEMMVRMPIAEYLRDCGYNVLEAGSASEAIAAIDAEGPVSVVFSDVRMPGSMDGFGLAAWFRSHYPNVPVLLTSGYNGGRNLSATTVPGSRFIEKPYSQIQVERRIASLLAA